MNKTVLQVSGMKQKTAAVGRLETSKNITLAVKLPPLTSPKRTEKIWELGS